jgi:chromatin-remodeling ATPase INO80
VPPQSHRDGLHGRSPVLDHANAHDRAHVEDVRPHTRHFTSGGQDAGRELERFAIEDPYEYPNNRAGKKLGKDKEVNKRPVSDTNSDIEAFRKADETGPAQKKRKLDRNAGSGHESVANPADNLSASAAVLKLTSSRLKGKGKQFQREASSDSLSLTPKSVRAKGSKKKLGASEPDPELASHPPSLSGDVTPTILPSRPASPLAITSTFVYELGEDIPPLKKAKKMDENAMIKRVKALEETQRKVWTNIARRDITKV